MSMLSVIKRLFGLMMQPALRTRRDVAAGVGIEATNILLGVAGPYVLKLLVDALSGGAVAPGRLLGLVAVFVLAWSGPTLTAALKYVHTTRIIDAISRDLVCRAMGSHLPIVAREREGDTGRMLGQLERLPFSLQIVIDGLMWRAVPLLIQVVVSLAVLSTLVPFLYVAIMAAVLLGYTIATQMSAGRFQAQAKVTNQAVAVVSQALGDVLRNARRVVFNGNVARELAEVDQRVGERRAANERLSWLLVRTAVSQYLVVGVGLIAMLALGGTDVARGALTVGDFVLLQAYAFRLAVPLGGFGFLVRQAGVSIVNIREALDMIAAEEHRPAVSAEPTTAASIGLRDLGFRYSEDQWALRGLEATIAAGSFVVIAGPNGSGKSTLAQLMAGLLTPTEGAVEVDGADLAAIDPDERHRRILYVPQYVGLFNRSLRENALYPPTRQTEADLAVLLGEWRFYESGRPVNFDLMVGEQGERLSGGQIQKLELARLAGVDVPAIILDETTSSLDARSEVAAIETLRSCFGGRTTLVLISHRLRLARDADQVLFLRSGRMVAGAHDALVRQSEDYREFWSLQGD
ncbi:ABC transporter ATP-binding protein [Brevundimonas diminuta]|uniref:ABC transporter ATP-binding protein n=1 Tax=Brevundimonas diminuta TaxID=293 RepID=UPI00199FF401|nr:ABC transporter ATP-binding protein [Brevundimonas diminuta]MBD3817394.1 ABC transporter ATP-binding protein [Brevundimonas diminuta]